MASSPLPPSFSPSDHRGAFSSCEKRHSSESNDSTALLPALCCSASEGDACSPADSSMDALNRFRPPKADWYENLFAYYLRNCMEGFEAKIVGYKYKLFNELKGNDVKDIVEIGIGTGPNLKYYANDASKRVFGIDPNKKMEKYAKEAAQAAGLPADNFEFRQAVRRVLRPGGLYLFLEHVAAEEGTFRRLAQNFLNPLQQLVFDGCNVTRETGKSIAGAGFSEVDSHLVFISKSIVGFIINPLIYGIARK